jgi:hypothetical protein
MLSIESVHDIQEELLNRLELSGEEREAYRLRLGTALLSHVLEDLGLFCEGEAS